jgi:diaminopimelate epimerase
MKKIPFFKYSSCGNNFVVVDLTQEGWLSESALPVFAYQATNMSFGVGSDNLLILQKATKTTLKEIQRVHRYWGALPDVPEDTFIFRMFEPDGEEALCCGNGLMCIARHLHLFHGIDDAAIMTEMPLPTPKMIRIGTRDDLEGSWADMGAPRSMPQALMKPTTQTQLEEGLTPITLTIALDGLPNQKSHLDLNGHVSFTGEPHFVVFPEQDESLSFLTGSLYNPASVPGGYRCGDDPGSWWVERIGHAVNQQHGGRFPKGISVNFAKMLDAKTVENRCYERGVFKETLACGTGSMAVAYTMQQRFHPEQTAITVYPHRCRWHDKDAVIQVSQQEATWQIESKPMLLFEGTYHMKKALIISAEEAVNARNAEHSNMISKSA